MSPRAAWRLDSLGYQRIYDYVAGKADWLAFGLPHEGHAQLVGDAVTHDVPTAALHDRAGSTRDLLADSPLGLVVVLNHDGVVMGTLRTGALDSADDGVTVDRIMREGPATVRPSEELGPLVERMRGADVDGVVVTRSDGTLLGVVERARAEQRLDGQR